MLLILSDGVPNQKYSFFPFTDCCDKLTAIRRNGTPLKHYIVILINETRVKYDSRPFEEATIEVFAYKQNGRH